MRYRLLFLLPLTVLIVFFTVHASNKNSGKSAEQATYQAALRLIGHRLLLSAGDRQSRVLPIKELSANKFQVYFENPLSLEPDSIFNIISKTTKTSQLPDEYTIDVLRCSGNEVVYSFVNSHVDSNIIVPCLGRTLPKDCYYITINFALPAQLASEPVYIWMGSIAVLLLAGWLFYVYARRKKNKSGVKNEGVITKDAIQIGNYLFYFDQRYLEINNERIELTDKESKLLHILASSANKTIDREKFQKEVWENEGVIVTRSLDVFISRLRKKLEKDKSIRLINIHGKGYKLELAS